MRELCWTKRKKFSAPFAFSALNISETETRNGNLSFRLVGVAPFLFLRQGFSDLQESTPCVGELGVAAVNNAQLAFQAQVADGNAHQFAAGQLVFHRERRHESNSVLQHYELLDRVNGGQLR